MIVLATSAHAGVLGVVLGVVILTSILLYFVPSIVAFARHVSDAGSIFVINFFLGWTMIGWVVALAMAVRTKPQLGPLSGSREGASCPSCGALVEPGQRFCPSCGAPR